MNMEDSIRDMLREVLFGLGFCKDRTIPIELVRTKSKEHGDIATNIALKLAGNFLHLLVQLFFRLHHLRIQFDILFSYLSELLSY